MLSEHPNVRVHDDPAIHVPGEGITPQGGTRNAGGGFSLVRFFVPHKEMNVKGF